MLVKTIIYSEFWILPRNMVLILGIDNPDAKHKIQEQMEFQGIDEGTIFIISPGKQLESLHDVLLILTFTIVTIIFILACLSVGYFYFFHRFSKILHQEKAFLILYVSGNLQFNSIQY